MSESFDFDGFKASLDPLLTIPGTATEVGTEFWYFESNICSNRVAQFDTLLKYETSTRPETGGISLMNCEIKPPGLGSYLAIGFRGDLIGWRSRIQEASEGLNLKLARIVEDEFVVEGHQSTLLSDCEIRFFYPERSKKSKPEYREDFIVKHGVVHKS